MGKNKKDFDVLDYMISKHSDHPTQRGESCPDENIFAAFLENKLRESEKANFEQHLVQCDACQMVMSRALQVMADEKKSAISTSKPHFFEALIAAVNQKPLQTIAATLFVVVLMAGLYRYTGGYLKSYRTVEPNVSEQLPKAVAQQERDKQPNQELLPAEENKPASAKQEIRSHAQSPHKEVLETHSGVPLKRPEPRAPKSDLLTRNLKEKQGSTTAAAEKEGAKSAGFLDYRQSGLPNKTSEEGKAGVAETDMERKSESSTPKLQTESALATAGPSQDSPAAPESSPAGSAGAAASTGRSARERTAANLYDAPQAVTTQRSESSPRLHLLKAKPTVYVSEEQLQRKIIKKVPPVYPEEAKKAGVQGSVLLRITVNEDGRVQDVTVAKGDPLLNNAAVEAVKQWIFAPTVLNKEPVSISAYTRIHFSLQDAKQKD